MGLKPRVLQGGAIGVSQLGNNWAAGSPAPPPRHLQAAASVHSGRQPRCLHGLPSASSPAWDHRCTAQARPDLPCPWECCWLLLLVYAASLCCSQC